MEHSAKLMTRTLAESSANSTSPTREKVDTMVASLLTFPELMRKDGR